MKMDYLAIGVGFIVLLIGVGMIGLGLFVALLATKHTNKQSKARTASNQPKFSAEEHKESIKVMRVVGLLCILVGLVVFIGGRFIFSPYILG